MGERLHGLFALGQQFQQFETLGTRHRLADASHLLVKKIFEGSLVHANILTILRSYAKAPLVIFTLAFHIRPSELQRDGCAV